MDTAQRFAPQLPRDDILVDAHTSPTGIQVISVTLLEFLRTAAFSICSTVGIRLLLPLQPIP